MAEETEDRTSATLDEIDPEHLLRGIEGDAHARFTGTTCATRPVDVCFGSLWRLR